MWVIQPCRSRTVRRFMTESSERSALRPRHICIVGSGPAGMVLADRFAEQGYRVTLVESGTRRPDAGIQCLSDASLDPEATHAPMADAVARQWGGTSNLWGGRCVPYDSVDFVARPKLGIESWPFDFEELSPYWNDACRYADCGAPAFTTQAIGHNSPLAQGFVDTAIHSTSLERWSAAPVFAKHVGAKLEQAPNVRILLGCTVVGFFPERAKRLQGVLVHRNGASPDHIDQIEADVIIIACGGIESTRLLLNAHSAGQICLDGSAHLGKCYMGHLSGKIASIRLNGNPEATEFSFLRDGNHYVRRRITFTPDELLSRNLLNIAFWLDNPPVADPAHGSGILSSAYLAMRAPFLGRRLAPAAIRKTLLGSGADDKPLLLHVANVVRHLPSAVAFACGFLWKRYFGKPPLPGFFVYSASNTYALHYHAEQSANPSSVVALSDERDATGLRRAVVSLRFQRQDAESVVAAHGALDDYLREHGIGALDYWYEQKQLIDSVLAQARDGFHQIGSIRMARDATSGVADEFGRLFGLQNLYVCSSALFPTSGQANPTLTLLAFALRQADHITACEP